MNNRFDALKSVPVSELSVTAICHVYDGLHGQEIDIEVIDGKLNNEGNFPLFAGRCDCCGSTRLQYACQLVHVPTMQGYHIGRTCAYKIEGLARMGQVEFMSVALAEKAKARRARQDWITQHPEHSAIVTWAENAPHTIASDIYRKLGRYGSISESQAQLLYKIKQQLADKAAEDDANKPTAPAPEGRVVVELEVLGTKQQDGFRRGETVTKMICRVISTNAKVWLTKPADLRAEKGERFKVRATFERSEKDQYFAFGSRPKLVDYSGYVVPAA